MFFCRHELCHFKIKNAFNFFLSALNYAFYLIIKTLHTDNQIVFFTRTKILLHVLFKDVLIEFLGIFTIKTAIILQKQANLYKL